MAYNKKYAELGDSVIDYVNDREDAIEGAFESFIDSGSNENGSWVKFSNGTLICTKQNLELERRSSNFFSGGWKFPYSFNGTPDYITFGLVSDLDSWADENDRDKVSYWGTQEGGITSDNVPLRVKSRGNDNTNGFNGDFVKIHRLFAIGRWK